MLTADETSWLDSYHQEVLAKIGPQLSPAAQVWLDAATAPL